MKKVFICILLIVQSFSVFSQNKVSMTDKERPTVALVLEGGGALGLAHVGVIKVLETLRIPIDIVTGTSMGSIVGGLYALGYSAGDLERLVLETDWVYLFDESITSSSESFRSREARSRYFLSLGLNQNGLHGVSGLLKGNRIHSYLDSLVAATRPYQDFDDLPRRFRTVATDIDTGEAVVFSQGSLSDAMRASMGIPGVFDPLLLNGRSLVDGGLVKNLPVDLARSLGADYVIAVDMQGGFLTHHGTSDPTALDSLSRTIEIMVRCNVEPQLEQADIIVTVDLEEFTAVDFPKGKLIMAQGERAALEAFPVLEKLRDTLVEEWGYYGEGRKTIPYGEPIRTITIHGGSEADRKAIHTYFSDLVGSALSYHDLMTVVSRIYADRAIDTLRLYRNEINPSELILHLEGKGSDAVTVHLGFSYSGTFSRSASTRFTVEPGIVLRSLLGEDSEITLNLEALGAIGAELTVHKGLWDFFYGEAKVAARRDFDTYYFSGEDESSVDVVIYEGSAECGVSLGAYPYPGVNMSVNLDRYWTSDSTSPVYIASPQDRDATVLSAALSIHRTDNPVLPMDGLALDIRYRQGLPILGALGNFRTLESFGEAYLSLNTPVSLGLLWRAGLDLSTVDKISDLAPLPFKIDLADRRLFPNPLSIEERVGNISAGGGLEGKLRLDRLSKVVSLPVVFLFHGALGLSYPDWATMEDLDPVLHWNASLGTGLRINDGFALLFRSGLAGGYKRELFPYVAIDIGAIGLRW